MSLFKGETPIGVVLVGEGASIETTTEQIAIQTTQPTDPNIDLWINPDEISQGASGLIQNQYSESETKIGTWIDGKPLYRKVVNFTMGSINTQKNINIGSFDNITYLRGWFKNDSNQSWDIPNVWVENGVTNAIWLVNDAPNGNIIEQHNYSFPSGKNATLIVEYTKPTD